MTPDMAHLRTEMVLRDRLESEQREFSDAFWKALRTAFDALPDEYGQIPKTVAAKIITPVTILADDGAILMFMGCLAFGSKCPVAMVAENGKIEWGTVDQAGASEILGDPRVERPL